MVVQRNMSRSVWQSMRPGKIIHHRSRFRKIDASEYAGRFHATVVVVLLRTLVTLRAIAVCREA